MNSVDFIGFILFICTLSKIGCFCLFVDFLAAKWVQDKFSQGDNKVYHITSYCIVPHCTVKNKFGSGILVSQSQIGEKKDFEF